MGSGEWLEKALLDLCRRVETGLDLDADLISGLVSFCELAPPPDAADYLTNIIGLEAGKGIIQEYLQKRGYVDSYKNTPDVQTPKLQVYVKPREDGVNFVTKKQTREPKGVATSITENTKNHAEVSESRSNTRGNSNIPKKKKAGKAVSLAEAAKGSVVFKQGKPCSCQARRHKLVSNCLSCGKIVCEQEGEGPCVFCGALVLKEGSTYAGLEEFAVPLSDSEAAAEAYAKRLVEYDRNSAARTKVIDDQGDYYEIEGNSWLSEKEKEVVKKKRDEIEQADEARRRQVIVSFDLLGRKVVVNKDEASELESEYSIMRPPEGREENRIKPNPTAKVQPVFIDTGPVRDQPKGKAKGKGKENRVSASGMCLEVSGRVQHDGSEIRRFIDGTLSDAVPVRGRHASTLSHDEDDHECFLDFD